jgi:MFS family permease
MSSTTVTYNSVGYWQLVRQNGRFRRLWIAQLISAAGDWFNSVAVLGLVLQLTNSGLGASLVILCNTIPSFFLIPLVGPIVDRFDRRNLMILTNLASTVAALLFLFVHDSSTLWLVYLTTILLVVSASFFAPASSASIPNIVTSEELFAANALSGATWGVMLMVGSALGGLVSVAFGRQIAFWINGASFLVAAILVATVEIPSPKTTKAISPWRDFADGLDYLRHYLPAVSMVAIETGWGIAAGAFVLLSVFGVEVFKAGDAGIGFLYAARGLGALIGPFIVRAWVGHEVGKFRKSICISFLISAVGYCVFAASGWLNVLVLGCLGLFIGHLGGGIIWTLGSVMLQTTTPDRLRGRVFAVNHGLATLTTGISTLFYGLALQANASPMVLAVVGAALFGAYGLLWGLVTAQGKFSLTASNMANAPENLAGKSQPTPELT